MEDAEKDIHNILNVNVPKNSVDCLLKFSHGSKYFAQCYENLNSDQMTSLKLNPDFVVSACNLVENLYDKKHKVNKKELAVNILKQCLQKKNVTYVAEELKHLDGIIESLHSNGKIKRISLKKKTGKYASKFFLRFLN